MRGRKGKEHCMECMILMLGIIIEMCISFMLFLSNAPLESAKLPYRGVYWKLQVFWDEGPLFQQCIVYQCDPLLKTDLRFSVR